MTSTVRCKDEIHTKGGHKSKKSNKTYYLCAFICNF